MYIQKLFRHCCWRTSRGYINTMFVYNLPRLRLSIDRIKENGLTYLPTPPLGRILHKVNFQAEFNRFQFRVFLLQDKLPHQGWRTQSAQLFTHSWRENNWIHTFPKGINAMWNAISLVQNLNSWCRFHFLRR